MKTWDELKQQGSEHYKSSGGVEPIDLYRDKGAFRDFALCSIVKYAARNMGSGPLADPVKNKDMKKIIHYSEFLMAACGRWNMKSKKSIKRIKDLDPNKSLTGVRFKHNGAKWYWYSQWGYPDGKAGIWCKKNMKSSQIFPIFLNDLQEALEFEVVE